MGPRSTTLTPRDPDTWQIPINTMTRGRRCYSSTLPLLQADWLTLGHLEQHRHLQLIVQYSFLSTSLQLDANHNDLLLELFLCFKKSKLFHWRKPRWKVVMRKRVLCKICVRCVTRLVLDVRELPLHERVCGARHNPTSMYETEIGWEMEREQAVGSG